MTSKTEFEVEGNAKSFAEKHLYQQADQIYAAAIEAMPDSAFLHSRKAALHRSMARGSFKVADYHVRRAVELEPTNTLYLSDLRNWNEKLAINRQNADVENAERRKPSEQVRCPVCNTPTGRFVWGHFADLVLVRCTIRRDERVRAYFCDRCEHVFKTPFLTSEQLASLYRGYRTPEYDTERIRLEPEYTFWAEQFADLNSDYYMARFAYYDRHLADLKTFSGKIVDFGGNDGIFSRFVFPHGDITIADETYERDGGNLEHLMRSTDFLFCAHVFEHIPQPYIVLSRLASCLPQGAKVWIELPLEYSGSLRSAFENIEAQQDSGDFSLQSAVHWLHEHVSAFSLHSAQMLVSRSGLQIERSDGSIGILAQRLF